MPSSPGNAARIATSRTSPAQSARIRSFQGQVTMTSTPPMSTPRAEDRETVIGIATSSSTVGSQRHRVARAPGNIA